MLGFDSSKANSGGCLGRNLLSFGAILRVLLAVINTHEGGQNQRSAQTNKHLIFLTHRHKFATNSKLFEENE